VPQPRFARFAIALPLYRVFDYRIDDDSPLIPGCRYRLPFGNRTRSGILLEASDCSEVDADRIKPVSERLDDEPVLSAHMLELATWMSEYYLQPVGEVMFQCLPTYLRRARRHQSPRVKRWRLADADTEALDALHTRSPRQFEICEALKREPSGLTALDFKRINPNWHAAVKALEAKGVLCWDWDEAAFAPTLAADVPEPSAEQAEILQAIQPRLSRFAVHLLDGVTGSGKTEIYLRLIHSCLAAGRQAIYLVPEIGLTGQLIDRVQARFGDCFAISHSGLTDNQRYRAWDRFRRGEAGIMLGTRSSLFAQCERLGLIVIDEEHDQSYRQEDGVRYHARDVAIKRAQMLGAPVLLGSATPALESWAQATQGRYRLLRLPQRATEAAQPQVEMVDLRQHKPVNGLAGPLRAALEQTITCGEQALVFINRRGYAPVVGCGACGWLSTCAQR